MSQIRTLTSQDIQVKFNLPRITAMQIEEANKEMFNPNSTLAKILVKHTKKLQKITRDKNKHKRFSLRNIPIANSSDQDKYEGRLRKYSPLNSSISALYEEKQIEKNLRNLNPENSFSLGWEEKHSSIAQVKKSRIHVNYNTIDAQKKDSSAQTREFQLKLRNIRKKSESLKEKSRKLMKKADIASMINDFSYEKMKKNSKLIQYDLEQLRIEQQFSKTYRKKLIDLNFDALKLTQKKKNKL